MNMKYICDWLLLDEIKSTLQNVLSFLFLLSFFFFFNQTCLLGHHHSVGYLSQKPMLVIVVCPLLVNLHHCQLVSVHFGPCSVVHSNDAPDWMHTVSLIQRNPSACHSTCSIIRLWWNDGRTQGEAGGRRLPRWSPDQTQNITLIQLITHRQGLFWLICLLVGPGRRPSHTHTHTNTFNRYPILSGLFIGVLLISAPAEAQSAPSSLLNQPNSVLQDWFQFSAFPSPRCRGNYHPLPISVPCSTVGHLLVTVPLHEQRKSFNCSEW